MNEKKYATIAFLLIILTTMPLATAQHSPVPSQNHAFLTSIKITGHNATIYPLGLFLNRNHTGVIAFMRIWTTSDGYFEINKMGNSPPIELTGNMTITVIGFIGYACSGGNCSSGQCDPMDIHGRTLLTAW